MDRRDLLKMGGVLGAMAATPGAVRADSSPDASPFFSSDGGVVPLNAANLCPALKPVFKAQMRYARQLNEDVSLLNRIDFAKERVGAAREKVAQMLGVSDAEDIAFVRNTSEANSIVIHGLPLEAGDEVLAWSENHPTNRHTWLYRQKREPFSYREFDIPRDLGSPEMIVERIVGQLSRRTRVVSFSHISNISGTRVPARLVCEAIRNFNPDIYIHLDGAQSWGSIDVDLELIDCDSYSSSGHKFFMGPRGTGILYVKPKWARQITPSTLGYNFSLEYPLEELPETAERFECLGQRDTAAYAAIGDTVDVRETLGGSVAIEARTQQLTQYTLNALDSIGIRLQTNQAENMAHAVVVADMGSAVGAYGAFLALHNAGIAAAFINGDRVCCEPDQSAINENLPTYLRITPHVYNSNEHIDRAVAIVQRINESKFEIVKEMVRFF